MTKVYNLFILLTECCCAKSNKGTYFLTYDRKIIEIQSFKLHI